MNLVYLAWTMHNTCKVQGLHHQKKLFNIIFGINPLVFNGQGVVSREFSLVDKDINPLIHFRVKRKESCNLKLG